MTRKRTIKLTKFEMEIMDALWALGSGSIREVHENLPEKRRPAYTTVQTIIRRLEEKGAVRHHCPASALKVDDPLIQQYLGV